MARKEIFSRSRARCHRHRCAAPDREGAGRTPHMLSLIASEIDGVGVGMLEDFSRGKIHAWR
jgi:hypothetical protein